jgi:hypothetical protein
MLRFRIKLIRSIIILGRHWQRVGFGLRFKRTWKNAGRDTIIRRDARRRQIAANE